MNISAQPIPPSFTSQIDPTEISVSEGSPAYFKVTIDPGNGDKLNVDWYHNGQVIDTSKIRCEIKGQIILQYLS